MKVRHKRALHSSEGGSMSYKKKKKGPLDESIVDFRLLKAPNYSGVLWELL